MKKILIIPIVLLCIDSISQEFNKQLSIQVSSLTDTLRGSVGEIERDVMGNLFVADFGEKVWKISPWGETEVFSKSMYGSSGNALDAQGNLYQAQYYGNTIVKINRYSGEVSEVVHEGLNGPVGLAFNQKDLYICNCNGNYIAKMGTDKQIVKVSTSKLYNCPNGITVGPQGNLYVVNYRNPYVVKIDANGKDTLFAKLPASSGGHIYYFQGNFFITSFFDHKIFKISMDGKVTHLAGTGTAGIKNGDALESEFSFPNGIVVSQNAIYVNDKINDPKGGPQKSMVRKLTYPNLTNLLSKSIQEKGIEKSKELYLAYKKHTLYQNDNTEGVLNRLGYSLLNTQKLDAAIAIFKWNAESYPKSFNVWDSLGEAYLKSGDKENAKANYEQSLKLNPNNTNAENILKTL